MALLGADTTPYSAKGFNVEPQFRAMLHAEGVPEVIRLKLVEMKFDTTTKFALLGLPQGRTLWHPTQTQGSRLR